MEITSSFLIEVSGRPLDSTAVESLARQVQRILLKVDQNIKFETVNFAGINYRLSWSGIPRDMQKITTAKTNIKRIVVKYFENWEYYIKVNLKESGDGI